MAKYLLKGTEIKIRADRIGEDGVTALAYIDATTLYNALDSVYGPGKWTTLPPPNVTLAPHEKCIGVWSPELNSFVYQVGTGEATAFSAEKGAESDALKRAGVKLGIARELGTTPKMFLPATTLKGLGPSGRGNGGYICDDVFTVADVKFFDDSVTRGITEIVVNVSYDGCVHHVATFYDDGRQPTVIEIGENEGEKVEGNKVNTAQPVIDLSKNEPPKPTVTSKQVPAQTATTPARQTTAKPAATQTNANQLAQAKPVSPVITKPAEYPAENVPLADNEVILLGQCKGQKYGTVKNSPKWQSFLKWLSKADVTGAKYNAAQVNQIKRIRRMKT